MKLAGKLQNAWRCAARGSGQLYLVAVGGDAGSQQVEFPGEIWTVSFWLRPSLKSKNKKTTHT